MNEIEKKLDVFKTKLRLMIRRENKIRNEINNVQQGIRVGECFKRSSDFIRILKINGGYVNYVSFSNDTQTGYITFNFMDIDTVERFITEYDRITEEYFLLIFEEFLKTAHDFTTKKIKG